MRTLSFIRRGFVFAKAAPRQTVGGVAFVSALCLLVLLGGVATAQSVSEFERLRREMVDDVVIAAGVKDQRVVQAMLATPRHEFVPLRLRQNAYYDMALPIGESQTISSPFIVAYMTQSLDTQPTDKVLEIGTGSGYQAAVLSPLVASVYSIEIVESLGRQAARTLQRVGYTNVFTKVGDGFLGWPEHAPFDKIIVTCSPEKVPRPLVDQLREGGLMVVPVGERYQQTLYLLRKKDGKLEAETLRPTLFVPMTGAAEDRRLVQPDPANPQVANGDFELPLEADEFVPGWYYQRQLRRESDVRAPGGEHFITIENAQSGRAAHILQGFPVDGRKLRALEVSAWIQHENLQRGRERDALPLIGISFYDDERRDVGLAFIGPFLGSSGWHRVSKSLRVPPQAREGILRLGLFGATGRISFDQVSMTGVER